MPGICYNGIENTFEKPKQAIHMTTQSERIAQRQARARQIVARIREILPAALKAHPVAAAYVYGSVARGTPLPTSDLDIALIAQSLTLSPYGQLTLEIKIQADIEDAARTDMEVARADTGDASVEATDVDIRIGKSGSPFPRSMSESSTVRHCWCRGASSRRAYWSTRATTKHE